MPSWEESQGYFAWNVVADTISLPLWYVAMEVCAAYTLEGKREIENRTKKADGKKLRASLAAQWLRIHLPMQGTRV